MGPSGCCLTALMALVATSTATAQLGAVGGSPAQLGKWPWIALFGRQTDAGPTEWFCGGTLIHARYVLTAAHCVQPERAAAVRVRLGDHTLSVSSEVAHQERRVAAVLHHPQYSPWQNDIALVRLAQPAELTAAVQPLALPAPGAPVPTGLDVEAAGWGHLEFAGDTPDVLHEVPLRVTDAAACEEAYLAAPQFRARFPGGFQDTKVCAGSRDSVARDACHGDSGGPLMAPRPGGDAYELVGIVSTGYGCGNPKYPGIYTRVSAYVDWIRDNME